MIGVAHKVCIIVSRIDAQRSLLAPVDAKTRLENKEDHLLIVQRQMICKYHVLTVNSTIRYFIKPLCKQRGFSYALR